MAEGGTPQKKPKTMFQGSNMKVFVLEPTEERLTQDGKSYGITYVLAKTTNFQDLHELSMPEKWISKMKSSINRSLIVRGYAMRQDGGIRLSDYSTVFDTATEQISLQTKQQFTSPPLEDIATIKTKQKGARVSLKGTVDRMTNVLIGNNSKRKIVTITDQTGSVELKLWGQEMIDKITEEGTCVEVKCVTVEHYNTKTSLNSNMSTRILHNQEADTINGTIEGACFEEESMSVVINDNIYQVLPALMGRIFPLFSFEENISISAQSRGKQIISILQRQDGNQNEK